MFGEDEEIFDVLDQVLKDTDLEKIDADSNGNSTSLPDGYYLNEVLSAKLTKTKKDGSPMVSMEFVIVEDGYNAEKDENLNVNIVEIKGTKNKHIWKNYVLTDTKSVQRFVSDMLKFEDSTTQQPLLGKEYFTNSYLLCDALECLIGMRIYIQVSTSEKDGKSNTFNNLISWKRATAIGLAV